MTAFAGIVLAGGRSSRMGRDKSALVLEGRSLLEHAIDGLRGAGAMRIIVTGEGEGRVPDRRPGLGPVAGIDAALAELPDGPAVVVPVDMPRLDAAVLERLVHAMPLLRSVAFEGHPLPWAFRVDARSRHAVAKVLDAIGSQRSLRALQGALDTATLVVADGMAERLVNVNTPAEWSAFAR